MSKKDPARLLHVLVTPSLLETGRIAVSPAEEWLQVSVIALQGGASMNGHTHVDRPLPPVQSRPTQEAWLVLRGSLEVKLYDEDHALLDDATIEESQMLVTFRGGHSFHNAAKGTVLIEIKNGPYTGRDYTSFGDERP